jgi:hypothetical protein
MQYQQFSEKKGKRRDFFHDMNIAFTGYHLGQDGSISLFPVKNMTCRKATMGPEMLSHNQFHKKLRSYGEKSDKADRVLYQVIY